MSPPRKAKRIKVGKPAGRKQANAVLSILQAGLIWLREFFTDLGQLLIRPSDMIPRLGKISSWRFFIAVFITFVLIMQFWSWLALQRFAPEGFALKDAWESWLNQALAVWLVFPLALLFITWAGCKFLFHQEFKLIQAANLTAMALIPLIAGYLLAGLLLDLRLGIAFFLATLMFAMFASLRFYSEGLQLIHKIERIKRVYIPPLVFSVAYLVTHLLLLLIFSRSA